MTILIDMNLSPGWVQFLIAHGIEAIHWSQIGNIGAPDSEIFAHAASHKQVVFTHDLDFGTLLAAQRASAPSVIQVRTQDVLPNAIGAVVIQAIGVYRNQLERGAILTIDLTRSRVRLLPL